ncbi:uncharacterized protein BXZ73DRAFT_93304 [Epithele typhae]|uniref:uncharacterized protein n=1 Tax=Epithele typhae TaxID=378194 RepID=UPI002007A732|nr:uncharacterized protein BXZ73DRAFT_93304 [Epithele typhae]KAH9911953.1 hypothetical protein BXZ73DRAFT_93304 [Epithele typhae]
MTGEVPVRIARKQAAELAHQANKAALAAITKLLSSQKTVFTGGKNSLQTYRAHAVESCLYLMVKGGQGMMEVSRKAAEANQFARNWGSRLVRLWVHEWVATRTLPESHRGAHSKITSLLTDPAARDAIRTYLRSNKWTVRNPRKLQSLLKNEMESGDVMNYVSSILSEDIPLGLKHFIDTVLLPRMQVKYSWVLNGEQPLKKKGPGRGLHQSEFICSSVGHLKDAGITLEYGKNHEGFWNGQLFVQQLKEKFLPVFRAAHDPDVIAAVLVDHSQGHSIYASDALRVSEMNMRPGGKQARMRAGVTSKSEFRQERGLDAEWLCL